MEEITIATIAKTKSYQRVVNYYETDQMSIVHHSNYVRYIEEARIDFLTQIDLPYKELEDDGILIPVIGVNVEYKSPLIFGEKFVVETTLSHFNGVRMELSYCIKDQQGILKATATSSHCFVDQAFKPLLIKKSYPDIYTKLNEYLDK